MAGVAPQGAFQRCNVCDIECSVDELSCWMCGGLLEIVPFEVDGELTLGWITKAAKYNDGVS